MDFENYSEENIEEPVENLPDLNEIFEEAIENFDSSRNSWKEIFEESTNDRSFGLFGDQWDARTVTQRRVENRTVSVFNKCVQNIRYVVNSSMKETPAIKVTAKDNSQKDSAEAIAGIVRQIENESNAKDIYSCAFQDAVAGGIGVFEICVDYDETDDDDEPIKIKRIFEPTSVFPDPLSTKPDFSDMTFLFHEKSMTKKEFERKYPDVETTSRNPHTKNWFKDDSITVLEYWKKENKKVEWYILNGNEVIDSSVLNGGYKGKYIPYVFIVGEDVIVNGERHFKSIIRDIKDYQRTLNYMQSEAIDFVSKNAKAPYIASDAAIGEYKDLWNNANIKNYPYLPYHDGKAVPQRLDPPPAPIGYVDSINRLDMDIRSTIGIRDPLQDIPATQSGKAIKLQLAQQNLGTFVWVDHLNRAIKHAGKIIVDLIPYFYNHPHTQQIIGVDGQLNSKDIMIPNNEGKMIDLSGKYSVTISTGSNYEDQRTETREMLLEMSKANPQMSTIGADILVRSMDFKESEELADRLFAMLPPPIQALKKTDEDPKTTMILMSQKLEQMGNVLKQTTENLQKAIEENQMLQENFQQKSQVEMQKIELQNSGKLQSESINNESEENQIRIKSEYDMKIKELELEYNLKMKMVELEIEKAKAAQNFQTQLPIDAFQEFPTIIQNDLGEVY